MPPDDFVITPVLNKKELREFLKLPFRLYANDPHWIPPLYAERKKALNPKKNPFYEHAFVRLFLARRNGVPVGRISAQVDREYEKFHGERIAQFGFFECENDPKVSAALFQAAEAFARTHQARRINGPFSFSINEECGLLVEGFQEPMMIMMPYNPPYYRELIENAGYGKAKDLYAWRYAIGDIPKDALEIAESLSKHPGLVVRTLNRGDFEGDLIKLMSVFNSAWSENWGFVPLTPQEVHHAARELKTFMDPNGAFLAELNGNPIAVCLALPNLYEWIEDLRGRLFPLGIFKLLWRIKKRSIKSGRLMLLGVKKEYRSTQLGLLSVLLYVEIHKRCLAAGCEWGELSWTLEDNAKVNAGIEFMGGKRYKTYRIFEKKL